MRVPLKCALLFLLGACVAKADSPRWDLMHQDGYVVDIHHVEVPWFNKSYLTIEKFEMVKFNRTFRRVCNASLHLLKEVSNDVTAKVQFYKLTRSNQYKFFPFTATFELCHEYERNTFGSKDMIAKFTNLNPCPQKPGHLYIINMYADHTRFPPLIPTGDYKVEVKVYHKSDGLVTFKIFVAIIPKAQAQYEN